MARVATRITDCVGTYPRGHNCVHNCAASPSALQHDAHPFTLQSKVIDRSVTAHRTFTHSLRAHLTPTFASLFSCRPSAHSQSHLALSRAGNCTNHGRVSPLRHVESRLPWNGVEAGVLVAGLIRRADLVVRGDALDGALALEHRRRSSSSAVRRHGGPNRGTWSGSGLG